MNASMNRINGTSNRRPSIATTVSLGIHSGRARRYRGDVVDLRRRFGPELVVVGLGARGELLSELGREAVHIPAFPAPDILSTVGSSGSSSA